MAKQQNNGALQHFTGDPDSRPRFYKIMWPTKMTDLEIPPAFVKHLASEESDTVTLNSPLGSWTVKVVVEGGDTFLKEGWENFAECHSLGDFECVFFKYKGGMCFDVVVYEKDGTARKYKQTNRVDDDQEHSASSFTSPFPHFKCIMKDSNIGSKSSLIIPMYFSRNYVDLCAPATIYLRSPEGSYWMVTIIRSRTTQHLISKGWKKFSDDNLLKKGDTCVFELVDEETLQFHICRST